MEKTEQKTKALDFILMAIYPHYVGTIFTAKAKCCRSLISKRETPQFDSRPER